MKIATFCLLSMLPVAAFAESASPRPQTFLVAPEKYEAMRGAARHRVAGWQETALGELRTAAERSMSLGPWSVLDKKPEHLAPSGDRHDFVSYSHYHWQRPDGTWEWRDGQRNPAVITADQNAIGRVETTSRTLALAGYLFGEERYLERAALILRYWFLDEKTRMNPNLNYAAGMPGRTDGRGVGLHRLKNFAYLVDTIGLVGTSRFWTRGDQEKMVTWTREYMTWALTSRLGLEERNAPNNHAVYYGSHILACALFVGDAAVTDEYLNRYFQERLIMQIEPDGTMPQELKRTRPISYVVYTLTGFSIYAELAHHRGVDFYRFKGPRGQSLHAAIQASIPLLHAEPAVARGDLQDRLQLASVFPIARLAVLRTGDTSYERYMQTTFTNWATDERNLLWPPVTGAPSR